MGEIEWSMWANEQALVSSVVACLGGILAVAGQFTLWQIGAYTIAVSMLVVILEYPRGKRKQGHNVERQGQFCFTAVMRQGRLVTRNYYIRALFYLLISIACCFHVSTLLGGVCFLITGLTYLLAGLKGEEWTPIERQKEESGPAVIEEPTRPPPRAPPAPAQRSSNQLPPPRPPPNRL